MWKGGSKLQLWASTTPFSRFHGVAKKTSNMSQGVLKGSIKSKDSEISGKFEGNIFSDTIAIGSTASIKGGINYNRMQAEPGAKLEVDFLLGLEEKTKVSKKTCANIEKQTC